VENIGHNHHEFADGGEPNLTKGCFGAAPGDAGLAL
jgi:hypothetical protein